MPHPTQNHSDPPRVWLVSSEITLQLTGGYRQERWCERFLNRGWPVRAYCQTGLFKVEVVDFPTVEALKKQRALWMANSGPRSGHREGRFMTVARMIKHGLLIDLLNPCYLVLLWKLWWTLPKRDRKVLLLCSPPQYGQAIVCAVIKAVRGSSVLYALDMRDYWSMHVRTTIMWHKILIERFVLRHVDTLTTVGQTMAEAFRSVFGKDATVVYNVATHAPPNLARQGGNFAWEELSRELKKDTIKILYTGSLPEGYYDLDTFVLACLSLIRREPAAAGRIQFVFVGRNLEMRKRTARNAALNDLIVCVPQVDQTRALQLQRAADALLFLGLNAPDNLGQVSMKIFEYYRSGRPILPLFVRPGSDVDVLMRKYCGSSPILVEEAAVYDGIARTSRVGCGWLPAPRSIDVEDDLMLAYERVVEGLIARLEDRC
jgi:hypothetical protein